VAQAVENRQVLTDVPADRVEKVVAQFKAEGAIFVRTKREPDGNFTVEATFRER
jgi:hypothetical protein